MNMGLWTAMGVGIGTAFTVALGGNPIGLAIGFAIATPIARAQSRRSQ